MILVDTDITARVNLGDLKINHFDTSNVQPASYDLRIGDLIYAPSHADKPYDMSSNGGAYRFPPYGAAVVTTYEDLELPKSLLGRIGLKSRLARTGIIASIGPQIDPGFRGKLFIALFNLTAAAHVLKYKDPFLTIEFHTLTHEPSQGYEGPYQGKYTVGPEVLESLVRLEGLTLSEMQSQFSELSEHVEKWSGFAARFDEFLETMKQQTAAINDLTRRADTGVLLSGGEVQLREISTEDAAREVLELFKKGERLYFSDLAEQLHIPLSTVLEACKLLESQGVIEGATDVEERTQGPSD